MDFFQISCLKESKNMAVEKSLRVKINAYKKQCLSAIKRNKKHLLKTIVPTTYALEKSFFATDILLKICMTVGWVLKGGIR